MTFMAVLWVIALVIAVLWILLPFAVFGTKDLLKELLTETKRTNELLSTLAKRDVPTLTREV